MAAMLYYNFKCSVCAIITLFMLFKCSDYEYDINVFKKCWHRNSLIRSPHNNNNN